MDFRSLWTAAESGYRYWIGIREGWGEEADKAIGYYEREKADKAWIDCDNLARQYRWKMNELIKKRG